MSILTIYNFGTNSHSGDNTITAKLCKATTSPSYYTEGVGSGGLGRGHQNPGNKNRLHGILYGTGTDSNVTNALTAIKNWLADGHRITHVNLCGWSRGAITCFKIANAMAGNGPYAERQLRRYPVHIFAFDPVPGSNWGSGHMWAHIGTTINVEQCVVIVAQHELRKEFAPALPAASRRYVVDVMPGNHSSIVQKQDGTEACYHVNRDRCEKFMQSYGTVLATAKPLSNRQIVAGYSQMLVDWKQYKGKSQFRLNGRTIKDLNGTKQPVKLSSGNNLGTSFFINDHHKAMFLVAFPHLHNELTKPADTSFRFQRATWLNELSSMNNATDQVTLDVLLQHVELVAPQTHAAITQRV